MLKKRFLKYFSFILVVVALFICFLVPVSAVSSSEEISKYKVTRVYNGYGDFQISTSVFSLHDPFTEDSYICDFLKYDYYGNACYNAYHFYVNFPNSFSVGQVVTVSGSFCVPSSTTSLKLNLGSFSSYELFSTSCLKMSNELSGSFYYYVPFNITFKVSSLSISSLDRVFFTLQGSGACYGFGINSLNYEVEYDMSGIVNGAASDIKANQDKNTDKILNGGKDSPGYSSADKSTTDYYQSAEDEINDKTVEARSSTVSFFNNFGALLNDTPVQRGLLAVSKVLTEFFKIGWLAGLIQFALGLGAFAFILGSVIMVVGKVSSKNSNSQRFSKSDSNSRRKN